MKTIRSLRALAVGLAAICMTAVTPVLAQTCSGADYLIELKEKHPKLVQEALKKADATPNTNAILWRVEKAGHKPSHLFGTMHVGDKRITTLPLPARTAIENADMVALEVEDVSPTAMIQAAAGIPQLMMYMDGQSLQKKLAPAEFAKLQSVMTAAGLPEQMGAIMRPWLAMTLLATPDCEKKRVAAGTVVLDAKIANIAKAKKIPVVGLETIKSQLSAMAGIPEEDQVALLRLSLAFADKREQQFETLIQSYLNRRIAIALNLSHVMAKIAKLEKTGLAAFKREVLDKRNVTMFDSALPLVDKGNAFIAVGALHLVGDKGLVAMFRRAGFTVSPVI